MSTSHESGALGTVTTNGSGAGPFKLRGAVWEDHGGDMYGVEFCPFTEDGQEIFAAVGGNRVSVFECPPAGDRRPAITALQEYADPATGVCYGHGGSINELKVHPVFTTLFFSASKDYSIRLWHSLTQLCLCVFAGDECHRDQALSVGVHPSGALIATGSMDHAVHLWPVDTTEVARRLQQARLLLTSHGTAQVHKLQQRNAKLDTSRHSPAKKPRTHLKDQKVASRSSLKAEMRPEIVSYTVARTRDIHNDYVDCVAFLGDLVLSKSCGGAVVVAKFGAWPTPAGDSLPRTRVPSDGVEWSQLRPAETEVNVVTELVLEHAALWFEKFAIDQRCRWLACGNDIGQVFVWDLRALAANWCLENEPKFTLSTGQRRPVRQLAFNRHSSILVAVCDGAVIVRWDIGH